MKVRQAMVVALLLMVATLPMYAQTVAPYEDFAKHLRASEEITPLTSTLFGDKLSLYNGETEFDVTDIDLPGNSSLPVRLIRRFQIQDRRIDPDNLYGFDDWDLDVPYIDGVFTTENGWEVQGTYPNGTYSRCSVPTPPFTVIADNNNLEEPAAVIWDGNMLHIPGEVDDEELLSNTEAKLPAVTDGKTYPWVTKSLYRATCAPTTANGYPGESYVVVTPSGVRYTFNWVTSRLAPQVTFQTPNLAGAGSVNAVANRTRFFMLATRIDDRFGNWVTYTYNASSQLTQIAANDGRSINVTWSGAAVTSATAISPTGPARTWQYTYGSNGLPTGTLTSVTLPDNSQWTYTINSGSILSTHQGQDNEPQPSHCQLEPIIDPGSFNYTIVAPSGAIGTFNFLFQRSYRKFVPESCTGSNPYTLYPDTKDFFDNFQLTSKQITGAGLSPQNWTYSYNSNAGGYFLATVLPLDAFEQETYIPQTTVAAKVVTVTDPTDITKYTFGISYGLDEGRLLGTEVDSLSGTVMKTTTNTYLDDGSIANEPFPDNVGVSIQPVYKNPMVGRQRPEVLTTIVQDNSTYTRQTSAFNAFAQPTQVTRSNTIPAQQSIQEQTTYFNDQTDWVLGQTQELDNLSTGETENLNTYNSNATLQSSARFGQTLLTYTYNAQGQLASFTDGDSHTTSLSNYYRGIPQLINYPDLTSQSAVVDDFGDITAVTDQNGHTTSYSYNAVGWPTQITYPAGDEVAWYPEQYSFTFVTSAERGIGAGHWDRTVTTGSAVTTTYFDAELRPILSDVSIPGTDITTANAYDWKGETLFTSYPVAGAASLSAITAGTHKSYDALERLIQSQQDSELGSLTTTTAYLAGSEPGVQVTDPNNNVTTTYFQVFDEPSYNTPIEVWSPGNVIHQSIARDLYGNPTSITQTGPYGTETDSVTKTLTYDGYHRLCRTFEPESGSTVTQYDGANNVSWTASGMTITESGCGQDQVPFAAKTSFTYNPMNRVMTILPPADTQITLYTYDSVGNMLESFSGTTSWQASYNYRNMLRAEISHLPFGAPAIGYSHDAYGHLAAISYPYVGVAYSPDALGRPTQVGNFASGISYWPNGQVASFTYGNGTSYVSDQNARQIPSDFSYGTGDTQNLSEDLSYDADANIKTVQDLVSGQRNKTFQYDGLNRLTSAVAPGLSINEAYAYDALNNLRQRVINGVPVNFTIDAFNHLSGLTTGGSPYATYGYDPSGDRTSVTIGGTTTNYIFDAKQQLTQVVGYDTYAYDASGRRTTKTPASGTGMESYFYDHGGKLMVQLDHVAQTSTNFIYLGSKIIARDVEYDYSVPIGSPSLSVPTYSGTGSYTVSWISDLGGTTYNVQEQANGGSWTSILSNSSATSIAITGKAQGIYAYQAQECNPAGCGPWGSVVTTTVLFFPSAPATITVPATSTGSVVVGWAASPGAASYVLQQSVLHTTGDTRSAYSGPATTFTGSVILGTGSLTQNGNYTYQVAACNIAGCGAYEVSSPVAVSIPPASAPTLTVPVYNGSGSYTVSWGAVKEALSYTLQQQTNGGAWVTIQNTAALSMVITGNAYATYGYQVQACDVGGCSAWSPVGTVSVASSPLVPSFTYTASGLGVKFTDTSTDSAGTITMHHWIFGNGSTSALANPSNYFPKAGSYSVSETVTDNVGNSQTYIATVTVR